MKHKINKIGDILYLIGIIFLIIMLVCYKKMLCSNETIYRLCMVTMFINMVATFLRLWFFKGKNG